MNINKNDIKTLVNLFLENKVLALPTESFYGLSSLLQIKAVQHIKKLKKRSAKKGFIVISSRLEHLLKVIDTSLLNSDHITILKQQQERATTWVVPVKKDFCWLTGQFNSIAVRLTTHPLLSEVTIALDQAIISTSANVSGMLPATSVKEVQNYFGDKLDYIYPQLNFIANKQSRLINLLTGRLLRE